MNAFGARGARATDAVREAISKAADIPATSIGHDDDLIADLSLDALELESVQLILEEIFSISVADDFWKSPLYRTPASLAEYCIARSNEAAWAESRNGARPRAAGCA